VIRAQVRTVADSESRMLLKTIVAATSPWVRIPRPPLRPRKTGSDLGLRRLSHCLLPCADDALGIPGPGLVRLLSHLRPRASGLRQDLETRRLRTPGLTASDPRMAHRACASALRFGLDIKMALDAGGTGPYPY